MIINTGQRTDIPAFYADWFAKRLKEGFVCVRNPYNPSLVSVYKLDSNLVDCIGFCTKNPEPMFKYMDLLKNYGQYWFVTITPYGKDIEPNVKDKHQLIEDFKKLSRIVGINSIGLRYDPIFINNKYSIEYHLKAFKQIISALDSYTNTVVISFIDLYPKVKRNFPDVREVSEEEKVYLGKQFIEIAKKHNMVLKPCAEGKDLEIYGADCSGCMKISDYEKAIGNKLIVKNPKGARTQCACYLSCDIGAYNTCKHLCKYCYANAENKKVIENAKLHNPDSPFLIGNYQDGDKIHYVKQESWLERQISLI